jgi:hypothetical protein
VTNTFASADYVAGRLVFNIGGNKYRIIASVDFQEQILIVDKVMTHEQYDKETISGKTPAHLLPVFGQRSHVSEALNGKRQVSLEQARKLAKIFSVKPRVFI